MPLSRGQVLNNRYRIVKLLGQGGFGAVYRSWDMNLKRPFALKENLDLSPESVRQFEREASFLADLTHPNLPRVIDCFLIPEQGQYLVMDFIEGETLEDIVEQSGRFLPEGQVIPWISQVCDALAFLHAQNPPVIHRDVKPANIKITPEGKAVLVDFGIAKAYFGQMQTTVGARAVTEGYSPPEQYGYGITDNRSDIYSLGATLYHALTGHRPLESVQRYLGSDLVPPRSLNKAISPKVEKSIIKAMAVDASNRYQNVDDFKADLETPQEADAALSVVIHPYKNETSARVDKKLVFDAPRVPSVALQPAEVKKSKRSTILKFGLAFIAVMCILTTGLGGLWTYFSYLSGSSTSTATPTLITEVATSTPFPILTPTDLPTEVPTVASPTWTPSPTSTDTPPPPTPTEPPTDELAEWDPCPGFYLSRIHVGDQAYVSFDPPWRNNVREEHNLSATIIGGLEPGEKMNIIGGPFCADNMIWWNIEAIHMSLVGWTSEGDSDNYWLVPLP